VLARSEAPESDTSVTKADKARIRRSLSYQFNAFWMTGRARARSRRLHRRQRPGWCLWLATRVLGQQQIKPHKVRYYLERRVRAEEDGCVFTARPHKGIFDAIAANSRLPSSAVCLFNCQIHRTIAVVVDPSSPAASHALRRNACNRGENCTGPFNFLGPSCNVNLLSSRNCASIVALAQNGLGAAAPR
jgi:hypothetical protein